MSKHLFGLVVTPYGTAANNRGENEGNITTLQKILWKNEVHTTVSAEAIRWALRYFWQKKFGSESVNRRWDEELQDHKFFDQTWKPWTSKETADNALPTFIDDDVMGFMLAEAAKTDGNDTLDEYKKELKQREDGFKKLSKEEQKSDAVKETKDRIDVLKGQIKVMEKGKTDKRRGALEVSRAISLQPFAGDITFNAKSGTKSNTSLYGTEVHATRYQYGIALTPQSLREPKRVLDVVDAITNLSEVAGNHSRFLYDFAPESVVFRWTDDFAPRFLYGFEMDAESNLSFDAVLEKVQNGDIAANELFIGGTIVKTLTDDDREILKGAFISNGIKAATNALRERIKTEMGV